ncbi:MAG: NAD(P)-dependent oxidoreductase [Gemmatimonadetes bacterium]|nr:NAD(P)-dependent oxidoreductase [Gemmatimonadota bacterium]MYD26733.1 NAD(P)-dependent oxidoreductase [Gemmatimonadota bacterium]MYI99161.1 NAD(P)-dependent oxidoreductase [Gemmatimonadota bacterium]
MKVGFIGLGNMGNPMAASLLRAGHALRVHDLEQEKADNLLDAGASWASSPREAASDADAVLTSLPGPAAVEKVVLGEDGVFEGLASDTVFIDTSTGEPELIRRITREGAARGIDVLDAPVSGGVFGARDATLTVFVGGPQAVFDRYEPLLRAVGETVVRMGDTGSGVATKLVNNLMMFINFIGACEGMAIGARAGIDPRKLIDAIRPSMGQSRMMERCLTRFLDDQSLYSAVDLGVKDMHLGVELGRSLDVPLEIAPMVEDLLRRFQDRGNAQADLLEYIGDYLKRAGVDPAGKP